MSTRKFFKSILGLGTLLLLGVGSLVSLPSSRAGDFTGSGCVEYWQNQANSEIQSSGYASIATRTGLSRCIQSIYGPSSSQGSRPTLTPRQSYIVNAVLLEELQYRQQTGRTIPITRENLVTLMQRVGAQPGEANMVLQIMRLVSD